MKKFMSVFGVLAITMMGSFAEEVTPQLEEAVVAEEVVNIDDDVPQSQENVAAADIVLHPEGDADFVTFIHQYDDPGNDRSVIANGAHGDTLTYMDETEEMLEIYNRKEKVAKFLSVENPAQYIQPGKCLVNIIHYVETGNVVEDEKPHCLWRLFCGGDMNYDANYAVEICGRMVAN